LSAAGDKLAWYHEVVRDRRLRGHDLRVAFGMLEHFNDATMIAWPTVRRLATWVQSEPKAVARSLARLCEFGWLKQLSPGGPRRSAQYAPNLDMSAPVPTKAARKPVGFVKRVMWAPVPLSVGTRDAIAWAPVPTDSFTEPSNDSSKKDCLQGKGSLPVVTGGASARGHQRPGAPDAVSRAMRGETITPPLPPPIGIFTVAHFTIIQKESAFTSSTVTFQ